MKDDLIIGLGLLAALGYLCRDELGLSPAVTGGAAPVAPLAPVAAPAAAPAAVWREVDDLQDRLDLIEEQKARCSGRRLQVKRCKKRLDKEAKKLIRRGSGGGFSQGAAAFGQVLGGVADVVGSAYGGGAAQGVA